MFVSKNNLESVKAYFQERLPNFSNSEINLMVKYLTIKRLKINESEYMIQQPFLFSESDLLFFRGAVKRLITNEPFQHIIGEVEFYGLELISDNRALIPRPETEELVDWVVKTFAEQRGIKVMDLCAGSGCIALAVESVLEDSDILAAELSQSAIDLIKENCLKTNLKIGVKKMNVLFENEYSDFEINSFDCWISNPPYIPESDKLKMHVNVLDFEPGMALFVANDNALIFYRKIAEQAIRYLKENGFLFFEIHEELADQTISVLKEYDFVNIELRKDLQGKDRMIRAQKVSSQNESE